MSAADYETKISPRWRVSLGLFGQSVICLPKQDVIQNFFLAFPVLTNVNPALFKSFQHKKSLFSGSDSFQT